MPPAPSYWQVRGLAETKQSPHRAAAPIHLWSPPRLNAPAARAGPHGALDAAPIPRLQSTPIPRLPRNPLVPRNQPWMTRRSFHRPTALASVAICPLLLQGQQDANKGIFTGWISVWLTSLFPLAPARRTPSAV